MSHNSKAGRFLPKSSICGKAWNFTGPKLLGQFEFAGKLLNNSVGQSASVNVNMSVAHSSKFKNMSVSNSQGANHSIRVYSKIEIEKKTEL